MTNEELVRQYYDGDEAAPEKLYHKNIGLIRGIAKETTAEFNCLMTDQHHPNQCSVYTKTILDDLCGEGALELLTRIQSREYDESRAVLTTYLYPHLKGRMTRWLEQNIGCMALSKDEMAAVRQVQRLYHVAWKDTGEIAEELGIPAARVSRYVRYNTHFLGVHDLVPVGYDGDPYEQLMPGMLSVSAEQAVGLHRASPGVVRYPVEEGQGHSRQDLRRVRIPGGDLERDRDVSHDEGVRRGEGEEPRGREAERSLSRQQASGMEDCSSYAAETDPAG